MERIKIITKESDLNERLLALKLENELILSKIKSDLTNVKTYLPPAVLTEKFTMNSFSGVMDQVNKQGLTLGVVLPLILNNTVFRKKSKILKTLVTSASLLIGAKLPIQNVPVALVSLLKRKNKKSNKLTPLALEDGTIVRT